jgi:teichuronic acid biosynthesis glycosyltransferase TuaG
MRSGEPSPFIPCHPVSEPAMSCSVSVIIPTYNSSGTLKRALDSVYGQSLLPREIIVVDDGSDDWEESRLIVASCPDSIAIRLIRMDRNQGPSAARNTGILASPCRYLAFLDSDCVWHKDKIETQYGLMTHHSLDFSVHGYVEDMNYPKADSGGVQDMSPPALSSLSSWSFLYRNHMPTTAMVLRQEMPLFDTSFRRNEDWKCFMELLSKQGCAGVYFKRALAGGFKGGIGVSGLSQDVKAMHASRILALRKLRNEGNISTVQQLVGICVEMVKYPVRVLRLALRPAL